MDRTRVKFCGITRLEDACEAVRLGADAIGLIFTARSKRHVEICRARWIAQAIPPMVSVVALFLDDDAALVRQVENEVRPSLLQFHGTETGAFCSQFRTPYIKAIGMAHGGSAMDLALDLAAHPEARGFVLDGHAAGDAGGQGKGFDWTRVPTGVRWPLILAGGLDSNNVSQAMLRVHPWAVDVSSGIESEPGCKDPARMRAFLDAVQAADAARRNGESPANHGADRPF